MQKEQLFKFFEDVIALKASDLLISATSPLMSRISGNLVPYNDEILIPQDTEDIARIITPKDKFEILERDGEVDFAYTFEDKARFRVNVFKQRSYYAAALRIIKSEVPDAKDFNMPPSILEFAQLKRGLVLVTGPTGSGKSTTLATILNEINKTRSAHVITLEDPIEFLHPNKKSLFNQREIGSDTGSYANALRACLRQDPDVLLIGEMRDFETISIALTTAETGHLVFSTLHTVGACKSIDRIVDVFPPHQQNQIRIQLAAILEGVVSIQLIPHINGRTRVAAYEVMKITPAIRNLIREGKNHQIVSQLQTGKQLGMQTLDQSLIDLVKNGEITKENALTYCIDKEAMQKSLASVYVSYNP
ncbi:MAG: Twitching mobility protein [Firmicutes bacterium ADurb.Bin193]|nr:MAG: Twitching mobility protein [Firmicutes bacterium ADurb.Bin193]